VAALRGGALSYDRGTPVTKADRSLLRAPTLGCWGVSTITRLKSDCIFSLSCSTLDFCLGGQRSCKMDVLSQVALFQEKFAEIGQTRRWPTLSWYKAVHKIQDTYVKGGSLDSGSFVIWRSSLFFASSPSLVLSLAPARSLAFSGSKALAECAGLGSSSLQSRPI